MFEQLRALHEHGAHRALASGAGGERRGQRGRAPPRAEALGLVTDEPAARAHPDRTARVRARAHSRPSSRARSRCANPRRAATRCASPSNPRGDERAASRSWRATAWVSWPARPRVLLDADCSIEQASATTWGDGTALASYRVRAIAPARARAVADPARRRCSREPLVAPPVPDVELVFDDASSPWHTRCTATGPDRPGFLHTLTATFAVAGVSVHSARITTDGSQVDRLLRADRRPWREARRTHQGARSSTSCCTARSRAGGASDAARST